MKWEWQDSPGPGAIKGRLRLGGRQGFCQRCCSMQRKRRNPRLLPSSSLSPVNTILWLLKLAKGRMMQGLGRCAWECSLWGHSLWFRAEPREWEDWSWQQSGSGRHTLPFYLPLSVATHSHLFPTRELLINLKKRKFGTHVVIGQSSNHITSSR